MDMAGNIIQFYDEQMGLVKERELFRLYSFKFIEQEYCGNLNPDGKKQRIIVRSLIDNGYIGFPNGIKYFIEHDISPVKAKPSDCNCSIGFSERENKWYGWSLRAVYGFTIGSIIREGDCGYDPATGEWKAETMNDAKEMAISFADSASGINYNIRS